MDMGTRVPTAPSLSQSIAADVAELQSSFVTRVAIAAAAIGFASAMLSRPAGSMGKNTAFWLDMGVLAVGIVAVVAAQRQRGLAAVLLVLGPTALWGASLRLIGNPWLAFFGAALVLANYVVGHASGIGTLILVMATLLAVAPSQVRWPAIGLAGLTAGLAWLSLHGFAVALTWSQHSQQRTAELLADLRAQRGELNRTLKALGDTSEHLARVNQELALARQEAEEARMLKEHFVANVSHELRTPLNLIAGFAEIMYLDPDAYEGVNWTPELVGDVGELYRAARHLQSMVNDVLDLSRLDVARLPMVREMLSIESVARDAAETVAPLVRQRGLKLVLDLDGKPPQVFADRTRIRQVLINLLNNAVRFTEQGEIGVSATADAVSVTVSVRDTGVGISGDQIGRLFERFQQADAGLRTGSGAGLGLALSRQFIELHGGKIWAESKPGHGSIFRFSLPLPGAQPLSIVLQQTAISPAATDARPILLIEQDPGMAELLARHIQDRRIVRVVAGDDLAEQIGRWRPQCVAVNLAPDAPSTAWLDHLDEICDQHSVPIVRFSIPSQSWLMLGKVFDGSLGKPITRELLAETIGQGDFKSVLIADDDPGFVSLVSRLLRILRYPGRVFTAYSGLETVRIAREEQVDLVLLDLILPDISGFEVATRLAELPNGHAPRVVAVTATAFAEESMRHHGSHFTVSRSGGISAGSVIELISAAVEAVSPAYRTDVTVSRA